MKVKTGEWAVLDLGLRSNYSFSSHCKFRKAEFVKFPANEAYLPVGLKTEILLQLCLEKMTFIMFLKIFLSHLLLGSLKSGYLALEIPITQSVDTVKFKN